MDPRKTPTETITAFIGHVIAGLVLFFVILAAALLLGYSVQNLPPWTPAWVITTMHALEMMLFAVDCLLFGRFIWKTFKNSWDDMK
jgi:hypothetical protein